MKGLSGAVKVGVVMLIIAIGGYVMFKAVSENVTQGSGTRHWAHFRDASGLSDKSRVVIAGLTIGEISGRTLDGRLAKVTVRVKKGTQIYSNATIFKKSSSLLGEYYLEIDPGTKESIDAEGKIVTNKLLGDGDEIAVVIEATSPADLMKQVSESIPKIDALVTEVRGLAVDVRDLVKGPIAKTAENLDQTVSENRELVHSILSRADRIAKDIEDVTGGADDKVNKILSDLQSGVAEARQLINTTQGEISTTGQAVRDRLTTIDRSITALEETLSNSAEITKKVNSPDQGTLGKLVNDPTIADNIAAITSDARSFTSSLFGLQTIVGLRSEFNFVSGLARSYLTVELQSRPDRYYLVEVVSDSRGDLERDLVFDDASGTWRRTSHLDEDSLRFSLMYAKRIRPFTFRVGIKENTGGLGVDLDLGQLDFTADLFDFKFDAYPRLRFAALFNLYKYFYIFAGIDDALNEGHDVQITGGDVTGQFDTEYHFGRDYFVGAMLKFTDDDLKTLLFVAGSALTGIGD
jgi:phospholipid/cholesterol/gamma-HCH transport system substrate-binding protein